MSSDASSISVTGMYIMVAFRGAFLLTIGSSCPTFYDSRSRANVRTYILNFCELIVLYLDRLLTFHSTKTDDGISFLGEGSLAGAPTPRLGGRGIHPVIKVIDDRCLYVLRKKWHAQV